MSLIELMIAMLILAVGLGGLTVLFIFASETNNKNSKATSSTMLAQQVLEQISAQHPDSTQVINLTDCAGNQWTVNTVGGVAPAGVGAQIVTTASDPYYGGLDPAQAYAAIPAGYAMQEAGRSRRARRSEGSGRRCQGSTGTRCSRPSTPLDASGFARVRL